MTIQEIEEFVQRDLADLNLSTKEKNRYISFITKLDDYHLIKPFYTQNGCNIFIRKFEECFEFIKMQGLDDETSLELTKQVVLQTDRKNYKEKLAFLRSLNWLEKGIRNNHTLRFNIEKAHAKILYLLDHELIDKKTPNIIIHEGDARFQQRFNITSTNYIEKYQLTFETKEVWMIISSMNDEKFQNYFGITRDELSNIYPTTKEELATIHFISTLSDEEIMQRYGITRQELLQKHPLNNDTLKALKSINSAKKETVEKLFKQPKEDVLKLRTITTEMIKLANKRKIHLQRQPDSKDENFDIHKPKKKGTYPNG